MPRQLLVPIFALLLTGLVVAARSADARQSVEIAIGDNYFNPSFTDVPVGTTVTWRHQGVLPHTVTADEGSFNSGVGSGDLLRNGDTFSFTFSQAGSFAYYCAIHGAPNGSGQSGTIIVGQEAPTPQPTPPLTAPPTAPPVTAPPTAPPTPTPTPIPTPSGAPGPAQPTQPPTPTPAPSPSASAPGTRSPTATPTETATGPVDESDDSGGSSALPIILGIVAIGAIIAAAIAGAMAWRRRHAAGTGNE